MDYEHELRASLDYIEDNLESPIGLEDLSHIAYLSKYHYHRLFHRIIGEPVQKYISRRRMETAASALSGSDERIIDIALKYQFGSQEAFSRAFKRHYGVSPGYYRKSSAPNLPVALPSGCVRCGTRSGGKAA
ncbi:helix-turn-helix transcriptional regulator [Oscillospiraceae bacterium CM]|nr:helix-turn-helix transcriptional regulator [Oscillospiraceae bacterium CM]